MPTRHHDKKRTTFTCGGPSSVLFSLIALATLRHCPRTGPKRFLFGVPVRSIRFKKSSSWRSSCFLMNHVVQWEPRGPELPLFHLGHPFSSTCVLELTCISLVVIEGALNHLCGHRLTHPQLRDVSGSDHPLDIFVLR